MALQLYVQLGRVQYSEDPLTQYEQLAEQILWVRDKKIREIVYKMIDKTPGMKMFLLIHSRFPIRAKRSGDWFVKLMIDYLEPTEEEIRRVSRGPNVPDELLKKLAAFDPEPIAFMMEPVRVEYQLYGRNPINVIDEDWEKEKGREIVEVADQYINTAPISTYQSKIPASQNIDDDLPF